jgi:replication protein O
MYKKTTQVPNLILDQYLRTLNRGELKILLVIIRQTYGWIDKRTGHRKTKDRISHSQFKDKTGLCSRIISKALENLVSRGLIIISDQKGNILHRTQERKGNPRLYFSLRLAHFVSPTMVQSSNSPCYKSAMYKTKYAKPNETKLRGRGNGVVSVGEVIAKMAS